jgi:thymidylate synthase
MASQYEYDYCALIKDVLVHGDCKTGRNGNTISVFGRQLVIHNLRKDFPLLFGRKLFPQGVLGEFAAFLRGPRLLKDFEKFGCNYWKKWADPDGNIRVDYGNAWINYNGVNQLQNTIDAIITDPHSRRHIIDAWRPDMLNNLSLPCCHFLYQWSVNTHRELDMIWYQRSVDLMIGLPSDVILAAIFNILMAQATGYKPGKLVFMLADTHIYEEHIMGARVYCERVRTLPTTRVDYKILREGNLLSNAYEDNRLFTPKDIDFISPYEPMDAISFLLKE